MLRHGDTRPIWLTEFGQSVAGSLDVDSQARYLSRAVAVIHQWPYVQGAIWYELYDDPTGHDGEHFGLYDSALTPRPAALAFQRVSQISG
jgi:hypothetical protein